MYVLHKQDPKVSIGEVQSVSAPMPQFETTYQAGYIQPPKMYVDVKIKVGEETIDLQKLPADQTIADFGTNGMVVSESRDSIVYELRNIAKQCQEGMDSYDYHKQRLAKCNQQIEDLIPEAKVEAEQKREIDALKGKIDNIEGMLSKLLIANQKEI